MAKWIIGALCAGYFLWACIKRIKDIRRGRFCGCGCDECKKCTGANNITKRKMSPASIGGGFHLLFSARVTIPR